MQSMKNILAACFTCLLFQAFAQDTFSICAVDPATEEVGSAGASCIAGSKIISDMHPGIGVVHTQAYFLAGNKSYAKELMDAGYSPQQIIDSLIANDILNDPTYRQYGIVDLIDGGRSAGFTGENTDDYKNHITGPTYAIQGNILLGQHILDSMEARFLNTEGSLACRLMAALQGANVPGADTRCLDDGISSLSAFLRVALPTDDDDYFIDLNVFNSSDLEPIDSLQSLFDEIGGCSLSSIQNQDATDIRVFPIPASDLLILENITGYKQLILKGVDGKVILQKDLPISNMHTIDIKKIDKGTYILQFMHVSGNTVAKIIIIE